MRQIQILQSGAISAGLLAVFVMSVLAEHIVAPGLAPADHMVSEYANAPGGWLITVGFTAWCCSLLLVAWIRRRQRLVAAGTVVAAAGVGLTALFHTEATSGLSTAEAGTTAGRLHNLGGELVFGGLAVAIVAWVVGGRAHPVARWVVVAISMAGLGASMTLLFTGDPAPGLRQRVLLLTAVAWQSVALTVGREDRSEGRVGAWRAAG